jgi:toxin CptA
VLKIAIRPSRRLALLLCAGHGVAAGAAAVVSLPLWLNILLLLLTGASCAACLYGPVLLRRNASIIGLEVGNDGAVNIQTRRGEWQETRLLATSFVTSWMTVLNLLATDSGSVSHVVILSDSMAAEDFRRLRVRLRWTKNDSAALAPDGG